MVFRFRSALRVGILPMLVGLSACGGGKGDGGAKPSSDSVQSLAAPQGEQLLDAGWLSNRIATQELMPTALPSSYVKGRAWALAAPTDVATSTSFSPSFSGRGWYIDPDSGDDDAPGTQARPWKTLQKASSATYAAGDALLLRCGKVFRGTLDLTSTAAPSGRLLVAGYGECSNGQRPVISGSDLLPASGWVRTGAGADMTHERSLNPSPQRVFFNGRPLLKARHPNTQGVGQEFAKLRADGSARNRFFLSDADRIGLANKDLAGATVYVRVAAYDVEQATITAHESATGLLTLDRSLDHLVKDDAGYILEGKKWMLDSAGEWWHDAGVGKLFVWGPNGESAWAFEQVEVTSRSVGIRVRWMEDLTLAWLQTQHHGDTGLHLTETDGLRVDGVISRHDQEYGLQVLSANDVLIENSTVIGAGWVGISVREGSQVAVVRNRVTDTGLFDRAASTDSGISVLSSMANISENVVYRSSHHGLRFRNGLHNDVTDNLVVTSCVRLTDCGGIYTFTASHPTAPASSYVAASLVARNTILGARSNREGLGTDGKNMTAGIFLDELTSGAQVSDNLVADTEAGIQMHDAAFNLVSGNVIRSVAYAGIRGMASRTDVQALKGNRITNNSIGYFTWLTELPGGESTNKERAYAQFWYHPSDAQALFQGPTANVSELNQTIGPLQQAEVRWRLAQAGAEWVFNANQWQSIAPQDDHTSPLLHRNYLPSLSGTSLVSNGGFQNGPAGWSHYLNSLGTGGSFTAGTLPECGTGQTCGRWKPGYAGDHLTSSPMTLQSIPGQNLYLLKFTVVGGSGGGSTRALIRRQVSPYENFGLSIADVTVAQGETTQVEQFFRASGGEDAVIDLRGKVGGESLYTQVQLFKVANVHLPEPEQLIGHLINARSTPATFTCEMLSLSSCDAVDGSGQSLSWPITVNARSARSLYTRDPSWLRP